jgi:drug/metabolite transporter (DMT)-like permease
VGGWLCLETCPIPLAASAMAFGYAAWNVGILYGNVTVLAGASYFIAVLSAALAVALLHAPFSVGFWQGALMVCGGSILCWLATRARPNYEAATRANAARPR